LESGGSPPLSFVFHTDHEKQSGGEPPHSK
jgi:hypothetical protein